MSDATHFAVLPTGEPLSTAPTEATSHPDRDGLGAARGLLSGIVLALPFWALVAYLVW